MVFLKKFRFILGFSAIGVILILFFWENDEKYLKKTTFKLLKLASVSKQETNPIALLKRVEKIAKHIHFDVQFKLQANEQTWEDRSAGEFRTFLLTYFKMGGVSQITGEDFSIQMDATTPLPQAHVRLKVHGKREESSVSCEAYLLWIKEKKWFLRNLEVSSCSPITY